MRRFVLLCFSLVTLLLGCSVNQVNAQQTVDCEEILSYSLMHDNQKLLYDTELSIGDTLTLEYEELSGYVITNVFWYGNVIGIQGESVSSNGSGSFTHKYTQAFPYKTPYSQIVVFLKEGGNGEGVNCMIDPKIIVKGVCGQNGREYGEECDDGNTNNNDGCSSSCKWEKPDCDKLTRDISPTLGAISLTTTATFSRNGGDSYSLYRLYWDYNLYSSLVSTDTRKSHTYSAGNYTPYIRVVNTASYNSSNYYKYESYSDCDFSNISVSDQNCGNGTREGSEQCDDGNTDNGDGCSTSCQLEAPLCTALIAEINPLIGSKPLAVTGSFTVSQPWISLSGVIWEGTMSTQIISGTANYTYVNSGIYIPQIVLVNTGVNDVVTTYCPLSGAVLSGGKIIRPETLPTTGQVITVLNAVCGNNEVEPGEQCDDGDSDDGDGCSSSCQLETPNCSVLQLTLTGVKTYVPFDVVATFGANTGFVLETIDRGDTVINSVVGISDLSHTYTTSGNHIISLKGKNLLDTSYVGTCKTTLNVSKSVCGDGVIENLEQCDDSNTTDYDGCSADLCQLEYPRCEDVHLTLDPDSGYYPLDIKATFVVNTGFNATLFKWNDGVTITGTMISSPLYHKYESSSDKNVEITLKNILSGSYVKTCTVPISVTKRKRSGGGGSLKKDDCPDGDKSPSYYDNDCGEDLGCDIRVKKSKITIKENDDKSVRITCKVDNGEKVKKIKIICDNHAGNTYSDKKVNKFSHDCTYTDEDEGKVFPRCELEGEDDDYSCEDTIKVSVDEIDKDDEYPNPSVFEPVGIGCRYSDENYIDRGYFSDTLTHTVWGFQYIEQMRINCLHRGRSTLQGKWLYWPKKSITKAEVMKTMVKLMGIARQDFNLVQEEQNYPGRIVFYDVPLGHWASWYTEYAKRNMIVNGFYKKMPKGDMFGPDNVINRYEVIKMIIQTYEIIHDPIILPADFKTSIPNLGEFDPYYSYVTKAEYLGFVEGRNYNGHYKLEGEKPVTREEFAKMAYLAFQEYFVIDVNQYLDEDPVYKQIQKDLQDPKNTENVQKNIKYLMNVYREKSSSYFTEKFGISKVEFMKGLYKVLNDPKKNKELITSIYSIENN